MTEAANIPSELMLIRNTALTAASIAACTTEKQRNATISATALVLGAEADLKRFRDDPAYTDGTHRLANQILTAITPERYDFAPGIGIPWRKPSFRLPVLRLAEKSVARGSRLLRSDPTSQFDKESIGYVKILEDAIKNGIKITPRGDYLLQCSRKIDEALKSENYLAEIGYAEPIDPRQLTFPFYKA